MKIIEAIAKLQKSSSKSVETLQKRLEKLPRERLTFREKNGKFFWYVYAPGERRKKYLPRKRRDYAKKLAARYVLQAKLEDQQRLKAGCDAFLKCVGKDFPKERQLLEERPFLGELLEKPAYSDAAAEWLAQPWRHADMYSEQLTHKGPGGIMMRSKSEISIAEALTSAKIPFRYECALDLDDMTYYPDFTIYDEPNQCIMIWEHLGLMDNTEYMEHACDKITQYIRHGYVPGINLILTSETKQAPFDLDDARACVRHYFGV